MKKLLSLALVLTMVLTMSVTAFAQEITGESGSTVITYNANVDADVVFLVHLHRLLYFFDTL